MTRDKTVVNKKQCMKKLGMILLVATALISTAASQEIATGEQVVTEGSNVADFRNMDPYEGDEVAKVETPADVTFEGEVETNETANLYVVGYKGNYRFYHNATEDQWYTSDGEEAAITESVIKVRDLDTTGSYLSFSHTAENLSAGTYSMLFIVADNDTPESYTQFQFTLVEEVPGVEDPDRIIDGGAIDNGIKSISNYLGIGVDLTRMSLGFFISLMVGLGIGWSEEYGSTGFAMMGFLGTFATLIFIGLTPIIEGVVLFSLISIASWVIYKND